METRSDDEDAGGWDDDDGHEARGEGAVFAVMQPDGEHVVATRTPRGRSGAAGAIGAKPPSASTLALAAGADDLDRYLRPPEGECPSFDALIT